MVEERLESRFDVYSKFKKQEKELKKERKKREMDVLEKWVHRFAKYCGDDEKLKKRY